MAPLLLVFSICLQAGFILVVCNLSGKLATKLGQPSVVGMMIAGALMGPSMFGAIWPEGQSWVFPADTRVWLRAAAELGVGGYLFCVGLDFNVEKVRARGALTMAVASAGVIVPFLLAIPLAISTQGVPGWFAEGASLWQQGLFLGAALSITAFPMLVWIVRSKGLADSPMGLVAISAGAIGDAFAWVILAVVLASFGGSPDLIYRCVFGGLLMIAVARYFVPRLLAGFASDCETRQALTWSSTLAVVLLFLAFVAFSAWCGMHAVFGGFLCGLAIPKGELNRRLRSVEPAVSGWVLPFFFVCSGLQTRLDFLFTPSVFWLLLLVVAVSLFGKGGACWCAARWAGLDAAAAGGVASLMNARGLMELILLNVGLSAGIVGPVLFSVLVVMAIVTTLMAGPLFEWTYGRKARISANYGDL